MKLLLDHMCVVNDVAVVHTLSTSSSRRKAYAKYAEAAVHFFEYADVMRQAGYLVTHHVDRPWEYDVTMGDHVVEQVKLQFPAS